MAFLHLNLKGVYFDEIKIGTKNREYRLATKWAKRLSGKTYDGIILKRGYPAREDTDRIIMRPWRGFEIITITHPHFGDSPVEVCSIIVN